MHLLAAQPGTVDDGSEAVDLDQTPGEVVFLTAADSEIASLSAAQHRRRAEDPSAPSLRLANLMQLGHNLSVDLYVESVVSQAKLVVVRLLGGRGYWPYGVERLTAVCRKGGIALALLPGDDQPDAELRDLSTLPQQPAHRIWQYCIHGGPENAVNLLRYAATLIDHADASNSDDNARWREPVELLRAGLYWPGLTQPGLQDLPWRADWPSILLTFYRALVQAGNTGVIDALIEKPAKLRVERRSALRCQPQGSLRRRTGPRIGSNGSAGCRPQRNWILACRTGGGARRLAVWRRRLPNSAARLLRRKRRDLAIRNPRTRRPRHCNECGIARGRRTHPCACCIVQGTAGAR